MKLNQAIKIVNETRIHMVIEVKEGYFETKTLDYLANNDSTIDALHFISKCRDKKVSFIHFNKARNAIEIDCYM